MAIAYGITTHARYQFKFFGFDRNDRNLTNIHHLSIDASSEQEARQAYARHYVLFFAARMVRG